MEADVTGNDDDKEMEDVAEPGTPARCARERLKGGTQEDGPAAPVLRDPSRTSPPPVAKRQRTVLEEAGRPVAVPAPTAGLAGSAALADVACKLQVRS